MMIKFTQSLALATIALASNHLIASTEYLPRQVDHILSCQEDVEAIISYHPISQGETEGTIKLIDNLGNLQYTSTINIKPFSTPTRCGYSHGFYGNNEKGDSFSLEKNDSIDCGFGEFIRISARINGNFCSDIRRFW